MPPTTVEPSRAPGAEGRDARGVEAGVRAGAGVGRATDGPIKQRPLPVFNLHAPSLLRAHIHIYAPALGLDLSELLLGGREPVRHRVERAHDAVLCPVARTDITRHGHISRTRAGLELVHRQHGDEVLQKRVRLVDHVDC